MSNQSANRNNNNRSFLEQYQSLLLLDESRTQPASDILNIFEKYEIENDNTGDFCKKDAIRLTAYKTTQAAKVFFIKMCMDKNANILKTVSVVGQSRIGKSTFQRHLFPNVSFKTDSDI